MTRMFSFMQNWKLMGKVVGSFSCNAIWIDKPSRRILGQNITQTRFPLKTLFSSALNVEKLTKRFMELAESGEPAVLPFLSKSGKWIQLTISFIDTGDSDKFFVGWCQVLTNLVDALAEVRNAEVAQDRKKITTSGIQPRKYVSDTTPKMAPVTSVVARKGFSVPYRYTRYIHDVRGHSRHVQNVLRNESSFSLPPPLERNPGEAVMPTQTAQRIFQISDGKSQFSCDLRSVPVTMPTLFNPQNRPPGKYPARIMPFNKRHQESISTYVADYERRVRRRMLY
eukprot:CAMPEP_0167755408 /NCGR_PEP_ID=MMETSP0110_2-20121227/8804_1 /TAXON_ID=629695 /ORGANISM="Gymnochlora sp., Strain CCMP2014" /LENGTH=281 /DNA_ID=CAMNT_0007641385 /DNA_START=194 /DNA_END=1039 /DNA_ORIENTATION=+